MAQETINDHVTDLCHHCRSQLCIRISCLHNRLYQVHIENTSVDTTAEK